MPLSSKDLERLALAWQCFDTEPKIDYAKFAEVAGLASAASARELMRVTKNKLKNEYGALSSGLQKNGTSTTGTVGTSKKGKAAAATANGGTPTPRQRKASAKAADAGAGEDDEEASPKKKKAKGKAGAVLTSEAEEGIGISPVKTEPDLEPEDEMLADIEREGDEGDFGMF